MDLKWSDPPSNLFIPRYFQVLSSMNFRGNSRFCRDPTCPQFLKLLRAPPKFADLFFSFSLEHFFGISQILSDSYHLSPKLSFA